MKPRASLRPPDGSAGGRFSEASLTIANIRELQERIQKVGHSNVTLDVAAQKYMDLLYEEFQGAVVLCRFYGTIEFSALPPSLNARVTEWARARNVHEYIKPTTQVWTLLGTRGAMQAWNDRRNSKGYLGLPLVSREFVDSFPMVARLFTQLGVDLTWKPSSTDDIVLGRLLGTTMTGFFYVEDAKTTLDRRHRPIIPVQDFVRDHGVRTVFGMGGQYGNGMLAATLLFCREHVTEAQARRLAPVFGAFRAATTRMVFASRLIED